MPIYEYECGKCRRRQTVLRSVADRDKILACDLPLNNGKPCPYTAKRVMSVPAPMPSSADRPGRGRNP